ncbi:Polygalacturonase non-catalytic subunit AroGP2 precursor, putative [Ricinus communis]|uniref:Polygalacturonase non-catalytic subunit AroGP2, putative n=1 Tax=Ricinus communis TaxID=3988 RepID=B9SHB2_RICCO|nr:Polygalacturonase non-catalytic subunit AroGP2 precursor, putative [Ricinus communis]
MDAHFCCHCQKFEIIDRLMGAIVFFLSTFFLVSIFNHVNYIYAIANESSPKENPFTPKASLMPHWSNQINTNSPISPFLLSRASPLSALKTLSPLTSPPSPLLLSAFASRISPSVVKHEKNSNFAAYLNQNFTNYGTGQVGGVGSFNNYSPGDNFARDNFRRYSRNAQDRKEKFSSYAPDANLAMTTFNTYGTGATGGEGEFKKYNERVNFQNIRFTSYADDSKGREYTFSSYVESVNLGVEWFSSYGKNRDGDANEFDRYDVGSGLADSNFTSYGENGHEDTDTYKNYGLDGNQNSKKENVKFASYFGIIGNNFTGYGEGAKEQTVGFNTYRDEGLTNFNNYAKKGVTFAKYNVSANLTVANKWVEPGKFFRESMLKEGQERAPSRGETKRCVVSAEDLIDFATSVLGRNAVVRTTQSINGAKKDILIGRVKGINGGRVTKSVSCHQSLYPHLLYYCHSVPKVRVYEAEILDANSKANINWGTAICHLDTSAWSSNHGAFLALGSSPGRIEVCHWIFENDMTWTITDEDD